MKLQQTIRDKFSIILAMAIIFLALPVIATAQRNTGALCNLSGDNTWMGGVSVAVGDLYSGEPSLQRSRVTSLTVTFDGIASVVDTCEPDAVERARILLEIRKVLRLNNRVVIETPQSDAPEWSQMRNYLQQAQAARTKIPVLEIAIPDRENSQGYLKVELKEVLVTSYQNNGGSANVRPTETWTLNFNKIEYQKIPTFVCPTDPVSLNFNNIEYKAVPMNSE